MCHNKIKEHKKIMHNMDISKTRELTSGTTKRDILA
jgi:hypothetical protein